MKKGQQVFPHRYQKRENVDGKWVYAYGKDKIALTALQKQTTPHLLVQAQGNASQYLVDKQGIIAYGPPNTINKRFFVNINPKKAYSAIVRDPNDATIEPVYLYPESYLQQLASKKAAKFVKAVSAFDLLNRDAERMMASSDKLQQDYGLIIWLNNNTQMRIGAHEDAASVDPKERGAILTLARKENWGEKTKQIALEQARKPTFGLLSLRAGHVNFGGIGDDTVTFRFIGKGGKENIVSKRLPPQVHALLFRRKYVNAKNSEDKIFHDNINYKKVWRMYKAYGTNPHVSRGIYAEAMVKQVMKDFKVKDFESGDMAVRRFNNKVQEVISDKLNHTRKMTERSYLTEPARKAMREFRSALLGHSPMKESDELKYPEITRALGDVVLWLELGAGNNVI